MFPSTGQVLLLLATFVSTAGAQEGDSKEPKGPKPATPLFASHTPLAVRVTADFKTIFKDRDTTEQKWFPGSLAWSAGADSGRMPVELTTRGHFRLKTGTCSFAPLRIRFPKEARAGTLFDKQGSIKLAVHCRSGNKRYEQIVHQEYLVYRAFNALTDSSFRVRLAQASYVDSVAGTTLEAPSFFIEDADDLGGRMGMKDFDQVGATFADVDSAQAALMSVFFYLVGNTDWSLPYLHNVRVFSQMGNYFPIPYDFDWSGVVDAPYARPDYRLGTKSVRERVWRGPCYPVETLERALKRITSAKDTVYSIYRNHPGLDPKLLKDALEYYDEFFKLAADPKAWNRELRTNCNR
ncbi:MAG TPA: hypothetical protein VGA78_14665 [Gemmatimonadales bacterium]